jgi:hypothetical protein
MSELKVGDVVTADSWDGDTAMIREIFRNGEYESATFTTGGFWRLSQLRKVEAAQ